MKEDVKRMLAALGLNPERRACEQLADLLERLLPLWGAPSLADAYRQTGARFGVRAVQVERNVRALILGLSDSPGGRAALRGPAAVARRRGGAGEPRVPPGACRAPAHRTRCGRRPVRAGQSRLVTAAAHSGSDARLRIGRAAGL